MAKKKNCPVETLLKNWKKNMEVLLVLKNKNDVIGYNGMGDFSLKDERFFISNILRSEINNYMFTGLQIINPKVVKNTKKRFSLREIFFKLIKKNQIYGYVDQNDWYHISKASDYKRVNKIL